MVSFAIKDDDTGREVSVFKPTNLGFNNPAGMVVYSEPRKTFEPVIAFFTSDEGSIDMNINGSGVGADTHVHNGTDNVNWTGSGGAFTFDSTAQAFDGTRSIDGTASTNGDEAVFTAGAPVDSGTFQSLRGAVYISGWSGTGTKEVRVRTRLAGVDVGTQVDLSNYVNTGVTGSWQEFTIPTADLGLTGQSIDELVVTTVDIGGGPPPNYYLDVLRFTAVAGSNPPVTYRVTGERGVNRFATGFGFFMADAVTEAAATAYNTILGVSSLSNGLLFVRQSGQRILFSAPLRQLSDMIQAYGDTVLQTGGDGTNRWIKIESTFDPPIRLREDDFLSMTVQDDLSGLLMLRASLRTIEEI